jgi:hypothetical protein
MSYKVRLDDGDVSIDDLSARNVSLVRVERMDRAHYWMMLEVGGKEHHYDVTFKRGRIRIAERRP